MGGLMGGESAGGTYHVPTASSDADPSLTYSTVSKFGQRYVPPFGNLTTKQEIEALVEGSPLSRLSALNRDRVEKKEGADGGVKWADVEKAYSQREGLDVRFEGRKNKIGGTVVVHYIKKNWWYLETALALLEGEERVDAPVLSDADADADKEKEKEAKERIKEGSVKLAGGWTRPRIEADLKTSPKSRPAPSRLDKEPEDVEVETADERESSTLSPPSPPL